LATALTFGLNRVEGSTATQLLASGVEGGVANAAATAVGAFGVNGKPLDDTGSWLGVGAAAALGYAAGVGGTALVNRVPGLQEKKFAGLPADVDARLALAYPADLAIAWGTADRSGDPGGTPPSAPPEPEPSAEFEPKLIGGGG
jgi:hypothetical protein